MLEGVDVQLFHPIGQSRPKMWKTFGWKYFWALLALSTGTGYKNCPSWKHLKNWWKIYSLMLCSLEEHTTAGVFQKWTPESSCSSWWENELCERHLSNTERHVLLITISYMRSNKPLDEIDSFAILFNWKTRENNGQYCVSESDLAWLKFLPRADIQVKTQFYK